MIKVLIVENEKPIADRFSKMINTMFNDIFLLDVCDNVADALNSIKRNNPEIVFLDVELNNGETSFDILRHLSSIDFEIIFVTAHNKYAVQAIKYSALDYLLKPITEEDLAEAIQRYHQKRKTIFNPKQFETLFQNLNKNQQMNQIALPTIHGLDFVAIDTIIYCEGEGSQTAIYIMNKTIPVIISKTLKESEDLFANAGFYRIHKSYLINTKHIKQYIKGKDGQLVMSNSKTLEVSRNYKDAFLDYLKSN